MTAEAGVGPQNDPHGWPGLSQPLDQQGQDRPGMPGTIDLAWTQVTDQQLITTKDVQGQETTGIVVAVEEPSFLEAMYPVIRSIEVEDQLFVRFGKGDNELLHQHLMNGDRRLTTHAVLQTAQGR